MGFYELPVKSNSGRIDSKRSTMEYNLFFKTWKVFGVFLCLSFGLNSAKKLTKRLRKHATFEPFVPWCLRNIQSNSTKYILYIYIFLIFLYTNSKLFVAQKSKCFSFYTKKLSYYLLIHKQ